MSLFPKKVLCSFKRRGDRAFLVIGPRLWNDLPVEIRLAPSLTILSLF